MLIEGIKSGKTVRELMDELGRTASGIQSRASALRSKGYRIPNTMRENTITKPNAEETDAVHENIIHAELFDDTVVEKLDEIINLLHVMLDVDKRNHDLIHDAQVTIITEVTDSIKEFLEK